MRDPHDLLAGRYRLITVIATGGMGVVWEAWDERLGRPVAIKQLRMQPGVTEDEAELAKNRAMREARITARLHHPNAVPVLDSVEHDGQPCLIMPYLSSTPLSAMLREHGTLSLPVTARIGAEIASALAAAHRLEIVHRDVKPGNILITADGVAHISDFGISHAMGMPPSPAPAWVTARLPTLPPRWPAEAMPLSPPTCSPWGRRCMRCWRVGRRSGRARTRSPCCTRWRRRVCRHRRAPVG